MTSKRKAFLLGLDGVPKGMLHRFSAEGRMPRMARLLERSAQVDVIPTLPALTCPGWLSMASGAHPGTHGVSNILLPVPGEAPDVIDNGFERNRARVELLWEACDRAGLKSIVLKYPGSWPPGTGNFIQVDGAGGYADITCRFEAAPSQAYVGWRSQGGTKASGSLHFPAGYRDHWRTHTGSANGIVEVTLRKARGWRNVPTGGDAFEFVLPVSRNGRRGRDVVHGLLTRENGSDCVFLSANKDTTEAACLTLAEPWSDWLLVGMDRGQYACRFKALGLSLEPAELWLYRSSGHYTSGFSQPASVAKRLTEAIGPVCEWCGAYDSLNGLIDLETQYELYAQHTDWLAAAIRHLAAEHPWQAFFTQWHVIEYAHHLVGASLDPEHPHHSPQQAAKDREWLGRVYALADRLLSAVEDVMDEQTLLVVASDHGHDLVHTVFYINHFLRRHGWLATCEKDGELFVDWSHTEAYGLFPGLILLNLKSRWSGGIVEDSRAAQLASEIAQALGQLSDPRTGQAPIKAVLSKDEMRALGQWGPTAPDLFFCTERGYEPATRIESGKRGEIELEITQPLQEVTSGHGSFLPTSASARAFALFAGPGFGAGTLDREKIEIVDIAPTIASYLNIRPPRDCDGQSAIAEPSLSDRETRHE